MLRFSAFMQIVLVVLLPSFAGAQGYPPPYPPSGPAAQPYQLAPSTQPAQVQAAGLSADTTARLLAGMDIDPAAPGAYLQSDPALGQHRAEFLRTWEQQDGGRLSMVREWSREEIQPLIKRPRTVYYMFGGPDFLWAANAFPQADTYILAGLEPVGNVPDLRAIPPGAFEQSLEALRYGMRSILVKGFYETLEMREDMGRGALQGVAPALYVFLVRTAHQLRDVEYIRLDASGAPSAAGTEGADGIRIRFSAIAGGAEQTLYYFKTDLSDEGMGKDARFIQFLESHGEGSSYLKAASYLMHGGGFDRIRNFLLSNSQCILQDDSGIPLRMFDPARWSLTLFGNYSGPVSIFQKYYQPDLREAFATWPVRPLPFGTGYRVSDEGSGQILAVKR